MTLAVYAQATDQGKRDAADALGRHFSPESTRTTAGAEPASDYGAHEVPGAG